MTPAEQAQVAGSWPRSMASTMERRTGPRKVALEDSLSPATLWNPMIPGVPAGPARERFVPSAADPGPLPGRDADIAFAHVTALAHWIQTRALSSERLTGIYLARVERFDPRLRSVITVTRTMRSSGPGKRTRKSRRASTAARCTACPSA